MLSGTLLCIFLIVFNVDAWRERISKAGGRTPGPKRILCLISASEYYCLGEDYDTNLPFNVLQNRRNIIYEYLTPDSRRILCLMSASEHYCLGGDYDTDLPYNVPTQVRKYTFGNFKYNSFS
ncbi:uncharacterized protein LOC135084401 [Ostrinia nubilalis]|uniref:uncharacterized protein LOC135084401 n=1 Tax=Ostrinia nubilalis TaxID=29057 RepID=UPI00308222E3